MEERSMNTFEAIKLMDSEGISHLQIGKETLSIDYDASSGLSLFYATFDGMFQHGFAAKSFRISFMIGVNGPETVPPNFKVLATKM